MIKSLEGLRGIAALIVALFHLKGVTVYFPEVRYGYLFVDLFFVLSGFVIASAYADKLHSVRDVAVFLLRRIGRLYPLLVLSTVAYVIAENSVPFLKNLLVANGHVDLLKNPGDLAYTWPTVKEIVTTLTMTHALGTNDKLILNGVTWSISVEFWTYILFALIVTTVPRGRVQLAVFAVIAACAYGIVVWAGLRSDCAATINCLGSTYDFGYPRCVASFILGTIVWRYRDRLAGRETVVQFLSLTAIVAVFGNLEARPQLAFALPFAFAGLIWSCAGDVGILARFFGTKAGIELGKRSYSIYMLHTMFLFGFFQLVHRAEGHLIAGTAVVVVFVAFMYLVAGWVYRTIEMPARDYFNRLARRLSLVAAPKDYVAAEGPVSDRAQ